MFNTHIQVDICVEQKLTSTSETLVAVVVVVYELQMQLIFVVKSA